MGIYTHFLSRRISVLISYLHHVGSIKFFKDVAFVLVYCFDFDEK